MRFCGECAVHRGSVAAKVAFTACRIAVDVPFTVIWMQRGWRSLHPVA
jgi:hypothetical protein